MLTYGFYNSIDGDRRYNADQMSSLFDGIIKDGVFMSVGEHFNVTPGIGLQIVVDSGRAWFDHTWSNNDSPILLSISEPTPPLTRIDCVVLEVNKEENVRANTIKIVEGIPSSEPEKPELIHQTAIKQYPLAYITIGPNSANISQADIENMIGTDSCPWVTGLMTVISSESLYAQWRSEYMRAIDTDQNNFDIWFTNKRSQYVDEFDADQASFEAWFENLQNQLDDNQAANLQHQIDEFTPITNSQIDNLLAIS